MRKINDSLYEVDLVKIIPKVNEILESISTIEADKYSSVMNKIIGDNILARVVTDMFIEIIPLDKMKINEVYKIHMLGKKSMTLHISNIENELDKGLIYNLV